MRSVLQIMNCEGGSGLELNIANRQAASYREERQRKCRNALTQKKIVPIQLNWNALSDHPVVGYKLHGRMRWFKVVGCFIGRVKNGQPAKPRQQIKHMGPHHRYLMLQPVGEPEGTIYRKFIRPTQWYEERIVALVS
jgi:hypothetical protein